MEMLRRLPIRKVGALFIPMMLRGVWQRKPGRTAARLPMNITATETALKSPMRKGMSIHVNMMPMAA